MCPVSPSRDNNCQSARELQITSNGDLLLHQSPLSGDLLHPPQPATDLAQVRRRAFARSGHGKTVETGLVKYDAEEAAEVAILSRDCMKHLGDWYYPEGGWGWVVFLSSLLLSLLSLGLLVGAGDGLVTSLTNMDSGENVTVSLLVVSGSLSAAQLMSPLASHLCLTRSPRLCAFIGAIIMSLAWLFTSFASELHQIVISYSLILPLGVSLVQASGTVMVGQYFRKRRLHLEVLLNSWTGLGLGLSSLLLTLSLQLGGWRRGLQIVAVSVSLSIILALLYRPASVYHPQRSAILHMRQYMRQMLGKSRYKQKTVRDVLNKLRNRTVRMILVCGFISSLCLHTPLLIGASQARQSGQSQMQILLLQSVLGLAFGLGSYASGLLCMRAKRKKTCALVIFCGGLVLVMVQCISLLVLSLLISSLTAGWISSALKVFVYRSAR